MTRDEVLQLLEQNRAYLATEFGVSKIGLFGSFAKGADGAQSDVDIVVEFARPIGFRFVQLVEFLEGLLHRKVDVLTPAGIQNIRIERVAQSITRSIVYV